MSGSHNGQPPAPDARYNRDAMTAAARAFNRAAAAPPAESTCYDLRTATEREADELAALGMRLDNAVDAVNVTALRVSRLEELVAVQRAAIERLADALRVIQLREGL